MMTDEFEMWRENDDLYLTFAGQEFCFPVRRLYDLKSEIRGWESRYYD